MKKITTPTKLTLKTETVKALTTIDLKNAVGGAKPTTTVIHTFDC